MTRPSFAGTSTSGAFAVRAIGRDEGRNHDDPGIGHQRRRIGDEAIGELGDDEGGIEDDGDHECLAMTGRIAVVMVVTGPVRVACVPTAICVVMVVRMLGRVVAMHQSASW